MGEILPYILLAEDDPDDRDLLTGELERQNIFVIVRIVNDGAELLSFLADCTSNDLPALILLDYNMPKLTAADVLKELSNRSRYKAIPKWVWSASDRALDIEESHQSGAPNYFVKPQTSAELEAIVRKIEGILLRQL
jgi:CheY-like chemotaxis protein